MSGDSYIRSLESLKEEMKRINERQKLLRDEKQNIEKRLYYWMEQQQLEEYRGYKKTKIQPKVKKKMLRRKKKEKEQEAIRLLRDAGIPDPQEFYKEFITTQKPKPLD